ncbi:citrate synthase [Ruania alba]|uniref:citrate synthase (unknown stereospecificity) n=1 Tax=Ruania alba TaxID=648782 RepID=A0A1H5MLE7_9MICO|nr:citrate synthase [Ruania alba]SEE89441.1 citrate synthase [Ruania alba]
MSEPLPRLTTAQAAARLGVKPATLYAYVSRGRIRSTRCETGGSTFDALEVEELAAARRSGRVVAPASSANRTQGRPLMVLGSPLTLIEDDELYFRGVRATDLARTCTVEEAIEFLWTAGVSNGPPAPGVEPVVVARASQAGDLLGPSARSIDRMQIAVTIAGTHDPFRTELNPEGARTAGRQIVAIVVDALPDLGKPAPLTAPLAHRLWPKLTAQPATAADLDLIAAALVLCLDHDLATATLAARVAATARAHPYAAVASALAAFDAALHGSASIAAVQMLRDVLGPTRPERAVAEHVAGGSGVPGFGHVLYRRTDPRAAFLFDAMAAMPRYELAINAAQQVGAVIAPRTGRPANLDLALAVMAIGADMSADAGQVLFATARTAGWIAHIADEYSQAPLRLRPESHYTGPRPDGASHRAAEGAPWPRPN